MEYDYDYSPEEIQHGKGFDDHGNGVYVTFERN